MTTIPTTALVRGEIDRWVLATMGACLLVYGVFIWRGSFIYDGQRTFTLFDDAMISMTYGRNLAEGHGLVWNVGGQRVAGFTNPLWTLMMAGCHLIGLPERLIPLAVSLVSAGLVLGCMALAACLARRLRPGSTFAPRCSAVLVGLYFPLVYWSLRGMEVGLVTFLVLAAVVLALRLRDAAGSGPRGVRARDLALLCLAVAVGLLARDDFVVPAVVIGGWLLAVLDGRTRWRVAIPLVVTGAVIVGAGALARLAYYGDPLPNTYYLKLYRQPVGPRLWCGLMSLVVLALADALVVVGVVVAGLRAARRGRKPAEGDPAAWLPVAIVAVLAVYSVYVGGDAWEWARLANRYLTPAGVLLLVLVASLLEPLADRIRRTGHPWFWVTSIVVPSVLFAVADSFVGVLLRDRIGPYLGVTSTSSRAAGVALVVLAAALLLAWFAAARRALPTQLRGPALAVVLAVAVGLSTTASAWWTWKANGGFYVSQNKGGTAYGLELGRLTDSGASIAVVWGGAPIYYSHRAGVDLLGKMDPVIAHGPHHPGAPMHPGHDKFDLDYSVGRLRPDVIAQYAWFRSSDVDRFVTEGYRPMRFKPGIATGLERLRVPRALLWVRSDSKLVHRSELQPMPVSEARALSVGWP